MTIGEARAVNVILNWTLGGAYDPPALREAVFLLAARAYRRLGEGWTARAVEEAMRT